MRNMEHAARYQHRSKSLNHQSSYFALDLTLSVSLSESRLLVVRLHRPSALIATEAMNGSLVRRLKVSTPLPLRQARMRTPLK